jgi:hypothetical protein
LPLWLATEIRPGGGYGATICAHIDTGVEITPCPFGPASRISSAFATETSSRSSARPDSPASP